MLGVIGGFVHENVRNLVCEGIFDLTCCIVSFSVRCLTVYLVNAVLGKSGALRELDSIDNQIIVYQSNLLVGAYISRCPQLVQS